MSPILKIREAELSDAAEIARIHVDTWRTAYKNIVDQKFLDELRYESRENQWKRIIPESQARGQTTFVAETEEKKIVGFLNLGPSREKALPYEAEIYALYVLQSFQKTGAGRKLFEAGVENIKRREMKSMLIWVLKDNPSKSFYEKMGGKYLSSKLITIGEQNLEELSYTWNL